MVVTTDGQTHGSIGGGALERRMKAEALDALKDGEPRFFDLDLDTLQMNCGGRVKVMVQPIGVRRKAVVFGAGHVGRAVAELLDWIGFTVTVVDPKARDVPLPEGVTLISDDRPIKDLVDGETFVLVATSSPDTDRDVLARILPTRPRYLGLLASPKKRDGIFQSLVSEGFSEDVLKDIDSPAGVWIGAQTPREITISIVAQVIASFRRKDD